jgi:hypothetical protein
VAQELLARVSHINTDCMDSVEDYDRQWAKRQTYMLRDMHNRNTIPYVTFIFKGHNIDIIVEVTTIYAITTKLVRSVHVHSEVYSIQHYVINLPVTCDRSVFSPGNPVSFTTSLIYSNVVISLML